MSYRRSRKPLYVMLGLLSLVPLAFIALLIRSDLALATIDSAIAKCAEANGIAELNWRPVDGLHEFHIGREYVAETPVELSAIECVVQSEGLTVRINDPSPFNQPPELIVWFGDYELSLPKVSYTPGSN